MPSQFTSSPRVIFSFDDDDKLKAAKIPFCLSNADFDRLKPRFNEKEEPIVAALEFQELYVKEKIIPQW